jgi:hypothetical protein
MIWMRYEYHIIHYSLEVEINIQRANVCTLHLYNSFASSNTKIPFGMDHFKNFFSSTPACDRSIETEFLFALVNLISNDVTLFIIFRFMH